MPEAPRRYQEFICIQGVTGTRPRNGSATQSLYNAALRQRVRNIRCANCICQVPHTDLLSQCARGHAYGRVPTRPHARSRHRAYSRRARRDATLAVFGRLSHVLVVR